MEDKIRDKLLNLKLHEEITIDSSLTIQRLFNGYMYKYCNIIQHSVGENREFHFNNVFVRD